MRSSPPPSPRPPAVYPPALGVDVSKYNGPVHWDVARANEVVFAGIRATISWAYRDPFLSYNQIETAANSIARAYYHVLYPGESVPRQVDNFMGAVGDNWDIAVPVLDAELRHDKSKTQITEAIIEWCERIETASGKPPIIYSRAYWINDYTLKGDWRNRWTWWLANYFNDRTIERPAPPVKPTGVTSWLIHQNCDKKPAFPGFAAGKGFLTTVDINRWNGDTDAAQRYFLPELIPAPPVDPCAS